jgi:hypothetical protein
LCLRRPNQQRSKPRWPGFASSRKRSPHFGRDASIRERTAPEFGTGTFQQGRFQAPASGTPTSSSCPQ